MLRVGLGWYLGKLDGNLPAKLQSVSVLGTNAPAYVAPTNVVPAVVSTNVPPAK